MNSIIRSGCFALFVAVCCTSVRADVVGDWNEKVVMAGVQAKQAPFAHTRTAAIVHAVMFDAINAVEHRYTPYFSKTNAAPGTSPDVAAAAAAHYALSKLYTDQVKDFDSFYQSYLATIPDGQAKSRGIQLGEQIAAEFLAARAKDGADIANNTYRPHTTAGVYVPTVFPVASSWGQITPFVLKKGSQFRPAPPISLQSTQWANDYNEVKKMGAKTGSARTAEQTDIARFWEATGPALHNPVARQLVAAKGAALIDNARIFALYSMAMADSYIAIFDAKYAYNFWRPVTAIRNADLDGNDATERDPAWEPFIATPMHPEYPCAHCINSAAGAAVLETFFGDASAFTLISPSAPGRNRSFARLSDFVNEAINARIYDGVHYRTSGDVGAEMGRKIGAYAVQNYLQPTN